MNTKHTLHNNNDLNDIFQTTLKVAKHKKLLNKAILDFDKKIYPLEFESYYNYFQLKSFEKGFSESGIVDLDEVRHKDRPLYYTKLMKKDKNKQEQPQSTSEKDGKENKEENSTSSSEITRTSKRRSNRLNNTETSIKVKEEDDSSRTDEQNSETISRYYSSPELLRLPEDVVPKVAIPIRRSDTILPPKDRYVRERQPAIKPDSNRLIKYSTFANMPQIKRFIVKCSNGEYKKKKK